MKNLLRAILGLLILLSFGYLTNILWLAHEFAAVNSTSRSITGLCTVICALVALLGVATSVVAISSLIRRRDSPLSRPRWPLNT